MDVYIDKQNETDSLENIAEEEKKEEDDVEEDGETSHLSYYQIEPPTEYSQIKKSPIRKRTAAVSMINIQLLDLNAGQNDNKADSESISVLHHSDENQLANSKVLTNQKINIIR